MTQINSKLTLVFSLFLGIAIIPLRAMEPQNDQTPFDREQATADSRKRWEAVQERARANEEIREQARQNIERYKRARTELETTVRAQQVVMDGKAETTIRTHEEVLQEADEVVQQAQQFLAQQKASEKNASPKASGSPVLTIAQIDEAFDSDPELAAALKAYANLDNKPSEAQIIENYLGPETGVAVPAASELPGSPVFTSPGLQARLATPGKPVQVPESASTSTPTKHHIDESFLANALNNILGAKAPMITAGTLGVVHYLYENKVFNQAVAVRSPKIKAFLHDYGLPTAREALAAHLIQLMLPHMPYLQDKGIRSFGTTNYLASFVATKMLGNTALYFVKMVTETEQGKKIVTHYKRLPSKTKETIAAVLPWLDFVRNMFMARSLASYFEAAPVA